LKRKQPDAWRDFGRYYVGNKIGDHAVQTVFLGMDAIERFFDEEADADELAALTAAMEGFTFH